MQIIFISSLRGTRSQGIPNAKTNNSSSSETAVKNISQPVAEEFSKNVSNITKGENITEYLITSPDSSQRSTNFTGSTEKINFTDRGLCPNLSTMNMELTKPFFLKHGFSEIKLGDGIVRIESLINSNLENIAEGNDPFIVKDNKFGGINEDPYFAKLYNNLFFNTALDGTLNSRLKSKSDPTLKDSIFNPFFLKPLKISFFPGLGNSAFEPKSQKLDFQYPVEKDLEFSLASKKADFQDNVNASVTEPSRLMVNERED